MSVFQPTEYCGAISKIDLDKLKQAGKDSIIIDLDETLIPKDISHFSKDILEWIQAAKEKGFKICITSNSIRKGRVKKLAELLNLPFSAFSLKPLPAAFTHALRTLDSKKEKAVMIGDQLFTDIVGANLYGIASILVKPLTPEKNPLRKLMRWIEKLFFKFD